VVVDICNPVVFRPIRCAGAWDRHFIHTILIRTEFAFRCHRVTLPCGRRGTSPHPLVTIPRHSCRST
jgi:hypothetical protein